MDERLADLMVRIQSGDEDAFQILYKRLGDEVFAISLTILRDRYAAQDICQDTFLKVFTSAGEFRGANGSDATVRSWVLTIARNKSLDHYRKSRREFPASEYMEKSRNPILLDTDSLCERLDLEALLESIPRKYREMVLLRVFGRLSVSECADILHVSVSTMKRLMRKGLTALREKGWPDTGLGPDRTRAEEGGGCSDPVME